MRPRLKADEGVDGHNYRDMGAPFSTAAPGRSLSAVKRTGGIGSILDALAAAMRSTLSADDPNYIAPEFNARCVMGGRGGGGQHNCFKVSVSRLSWPWGRCCGWSSSEMHDAGDAMRAHACRCCSAPLSLPPTPLQPAPTQRPCEVDGCGFCVTRSRDGSQFHVAFHGPNQPHSHDMMEVSAQPRGGPAACLGQQAALPP